MSTTLETMPGSAGEASSPYENKEAALEFVTDLGHWRLTVNAGRHDWTYRTEATESVSIPQTFRERYWLGKSVSLPQQIQPSNADQALAGGWNFLKQLQTESGTWGCNCDGPLFVTSGMVFAMYFTGNKIDNHTSSEMCRYLVNTANDDGGWGLFLDSPSTVFGTTVNYIMLRMLGLPANHAVCVKARGLLIAMGSALAIPTWGKVWLCILGLCEWEGMIPLTPELLLTPRMLSLNPANWWMPVRNIFISMSYLYGHRVKIEDDPLLQSLRNEIYDMPYAEIDWIANRTNVSEYDRLKPPSTFQKATAFALGQLEHWKIPSLRTRSLSEALFHIEAEVHNTGYLCLTPVSWASNMIALWHAHGSDSHWAHGMLTRFRDPLWMCREGLAASGTDGTAVWDTSLTVQAVLDSELQLQSDDLDAMSKALEFLDNTQIRENPLGIQQVYRHPSQGGWPFSTRDQGYAVSDTTAEALKAVLLLQNKLPQSARVSEHRLQQAVDLLLGMESAGGGFAAYEKVRGPAYLEHFNITDSYEDCMVESRYAECTGSVIMAFTEFTRLYPDYRSEDIHLCIERSVTWLLEAQFPEGGWLGSWGVCFSFASMFALEGLACAGLYEHNSMAVRRACQFLRSNQNSDGGWGEALESSKAKRYIQEPKGSQVPQTAYALVGLVTADCADHNAIRRGIDFLIRKQQPNGDWLPGTLEGIYTPPCGYRYPMYKFHFPLKALSKYVRRYTRIAADQ
ncbi:oxidosqualene-lanosterol cyclase [Hortaea werneckii]|nr:oxidosqualene-lanosterol cyclase [Hortaea werneckii]